MNSEKVTEMNTEVTAPAFDVKANHAKVQAIMTEIEKVIVGKRSEVVLLLTAMFSGSHILIEDVPGTGKTTLAATLAKVTGLDFKRAQFTPDIMASDITGFNIYNRRTEEFEFRQGLVMCNLLLADEINRASPKTQSALLEAMEESKVTVDGVTYPVPDPFTVIATQNPTGYVGTYPLPEAQLDRFALKIRMGYPSPDEELNILLARRGKNPLDEVNAVISRDELRELRAGVATIKAIKEEDLLRRSAETGAYFKAGLEQIQKEFPEVIAEVRGKGMMLGVELTREGAGGMLMSLMIDKSIIVAYTLNNPKVIRIEPPLVMPKEVVDYVLENFRSAVAMTASVIEDL